MTRGSRGGFLGAYCVGHKAARTARTKRGTSSMALVTPPPAPKATPHATAGKATSVVADQ